VSLTNNSVSCYRVGNGGDNGPAVGFEGEATI
jgi:hypothetical protein